MNRPICLRVRVFPVRHLWWRLIRFLGRVSQPRLALPAWNIPVSILPRRLREPHQHNRRAIGHFARLAAAAHIKIGREQPCVSQHRQQCEQAKSEAIHRCFCEEKRRYQLRLSAWRLPFPSSLRFAAALAPASLSVIVLRLQFANSSMPCFCVLVAWLSKQWLAVTTLSVVPASQMPLNCPGDDCELLRHVLSRTMFFAPSQS